MRLLDLPPEIFGGIIHMYVHKNAWVAVTHARLVCKTFAHAVHQDMFSRYSAAYYQHFRASYERRLQDANMQNILFKLGPKRCHSTYLLDHIDATLDFLLGFEHHESQTQRERHRYSLCSAVSAALSVDEILHYLTIGPHDDSVGVRGNTGWADTIGMLAAAAATGIEPAVRFFINKVRDVGQSSELYGTLLLSAAITGRLNIFFSLYECIKD